MRKTKLGFGGVAFSANWRAWRFGWARPMSTDEVRAGPADGDWWFCLGPLALFFDEYLT